MMNNTMEQYKGYVGTVEFSASDAPFYGKVMGIRALISYEGQNAEDLIEYFHNAARDYLERCKAQGKEPKKSYKGSVSLPNFTKKLQPMLFPITQLSTLLLSLSFRVINKSATRNEESWSDMD